MLHLVSSDNHLGEQGVFESAPPEPFSMSPLTTAPSSSRLRSNVQPIEESCFSKTLDALGLSLKKYSKKMSKGKIFSRPFVFAFVGV